MGFFTKREVRKANNIRVEKELYERIKKEPIEVRKIEMVYPPYMTNYERDFSKYPTTEMEDKYIALDGYGLEGNVNTKAFSYPNGFIARYLINIDFVKNRLFEEAFKDNDRFKLYIKTIAACHWQIGSKVFLEIMHDLGRDEAINEDVIKVLPVLDFYKNMDLFMYFNEEHVDHEMASKHEMIFKDLLIKYPFLQKYYDNELIKTKELYEEISLRICYYIYMIKFVPIPKAEKIEDEKLLYELYHLRHRVRKQQLISDDVYIELEQMVVNKFQNMIKLSNRKNKKLIKTIGQYNDR